MKNIIQEMKNYYLLPYECTKEEEQELEFLTSFLNSFEESSISSIASINVQELLLACLCVQNKVRSFSSLQKGVKELSLLNDTENYHRISRIDNLVLKFYEKDLLEELIRIPLLSEDDERISEIVRSHPEEYQLFYENDLIDSLSMLHVILSKSVTPSEEGREFFLSQFLECDVSDFSVLTLAVVTPMAIKNITKNCTEEAMEQERGNIEKMLDISFYDYLHRIEERKNFLEEKWKEEKRRRKRMETIEAKLSQIATKGSISISKELLTMLPDEETKLILLQGVLFHNRNLFLAIEQKLEEEEQLEELERLFQNSYFSFSLLSEPEKRLLTTTEDFEQVRKMLELLSEKEFSFMKGTSFPIGKVLLSSSVGILSTVLKQYSQGLIDAKFLLTHPEILVSEEVLSKEDIALEGKYENFSSNLSLLKQNRIDTKSLSIQSPVLLLESPEELQKSLTRLEPYKISYSKLKSFHLLEDETRMDYLDCCLELGLANYIKKNPNFLEEMTSYTIDRMLLLKELGIPFIDGKNLHNAITDPVFHLGSLVIQDSEMKDFLSEVSSFYLDETLLPILEKHTGMQKEVESEVLLPYQKEEFLYDMNGILLSRPRVLRNLQALQEENTMNQDTLLWNAIVYRSYLNHAELETLQKTLFSTKKKKIR